MALFELFSDENLSPLHACSTSQCATAGGKNCWMQSSQGSRYVSGSSFGILTFLRPESSRALSPNFYQVTPTMSAGGRGSIVMQVMYPLSSLISHHFLPVQIEFPHTPFLLPCCLADGIIG